MLYNNIETSFMMLEQWMPMTHYGRKWYARRFNT